MKRPFDTLLIPAYTEVSTSPIGVLCKAINNAIEQDNLLEAVKQWVALRALSTEKALWDNQKWETFCKKYSLAWGDITAPAGRTVIFQDIAAGSPTFNALLYLIQYARHVSSVQFSLKDYAPQDVIGILNTLASSPCLNALRIKGDRDMSLDEASGLSQTLKANHALKEVFLHFPIEQHLTLITDALKMNTTLTLFDVEDCQLSENALVLISRYIAETKTLQAVNLSENIFTDPAIDAIVAAIESNISLIKISMEGSNIDKEGLRKIAAALDKKAVTSPLRTIGLRANDKEGAVYLTNLENQGKAFTIQYTRPLHCASCSGHTSYQPNRKI